jgi:hypothetical protein
MVTGYKYVLHIMCWTFLYLKLSLSLTHTLSGTSEDASGWWTLPLYYINWEATRLTWTLLVVASYIRRAPRNTGFACLNPDTCIDIFHRLFLCAPVTECREPYRLSDLGYWKPAIKGGHGANRPAAELKKKKEYRNWMSILWLKFLQFDI